MSKLKVLILHHHMRGGGVTEVIRRTFSLFRDSDIQLGLVTGESTSNLRDIPDGAHEGVDGLSYGDTGIPPDPVTVYNRCMEAAYTLFDSEPDVWHVHNHSLGKNPVYTEVVVKLIAEGKKVLLHTHDFAEDNRPDNYRFLSEANATHSTNILSRMYPVADHVHYTTLNTRDARFLQQAGIPDAAITVIANPVTYPFSGEPVSNSTCSVPDNLILYPVRAIPRKNIGEMVLWSALYANEATFGITLAPKNPVYKQHYKSWVQLVEELSLPLVFEAGQKWKCSYRDLITGSQALITTSMAEGFGLVYLESFLVDKPLLGRDLTAITRDFKEKGIELGTLYQRLPVPLEWLGQERMEDLFEESIRNLFDSFGRSLTKTTLQEWKDHLFKDDAVDFGALNSVLQMEVIRQVLDDNEKADVLRMYCQLPDSGQPVDENKSLIKEEFNEHQYGRRLQKIYEELESTAASDIRYIPADDVLDQFLNPASFSLLRL